MQIENIASSSFIKLNSNRNAVDNEDKSLTNAINNMRWADYCEFSLDYNKEEIAGVIEKIEDEFHECDNMYSEKIFSQFGEAYGEILKTIREEESLKKDEKDALITILDKGFQTFAEKTSKRYSSNIADFFNTGDNGTSMKKSVHQKNLADHLEKVFNSMKVFYKNGMDEKYSNIEEFLNETFHETESMEELSFVDLNGLKEAFKVLDISGQIGSVKEATEVLRESGASEEVIEKFSFITKRSQGQRSEMSSLIDDKIEYDKKLKEYQENMEAQEKELKALDEKERKMKERMKKERTKLRKEMLKLKVMKEILDIENCTTMRNFNEIWDKEFKNLDDERIRRLENIENYREEYSEFKKEYDEFMKGYSDKIEERIKEREAKIRAAGEVEEVEVEIDI